ncbi:plasmid mobilization relaxosome protein MobC [Pseudozobellia sp. WGM2]|uniref:plasmid mobilization relaxosome protein MobC n=1 Tax=Pseudozobellia sp. WGM2 TaxID=2787625 RepID=UPI001AE0857E|nr:plasmid mobilization relaxosome protein MobC [Pseudozobellia sp. WGM2]
MAGNKGGRKRLGDRKREHAITLRFNGTELEKVKSILQSYNLDFGKRGTVGPFLRKLILNKKTTKEKQIPDGISNLSYQINKIGTNINQLVKVANYKNMRSPNSNLERELEKANELMLELIETMNDKTQK